MSCSRAWPIAALFAIASSSPLSAQGRATQSAPASRFTAIGCVSRQTLPAGAQRRIYLLTDPRGDRPTVYRLDGDATTLEFHIGHSVEISGPLTVGPTGARGATMTLKVGSLTYLSPSCPKPPK